MENPTRYGGVSQTQSPVPSKQSWSGYEPSDTETDWPEPLWHKTNKKIEDVNSKGLNVVSDQTRNPSPLKLSRNPSKFERKVTSPVKVSTVSTVRRRHSKSPYKPSRRDEGNGHRNASPLSPRHGSDIRQNVSPFSKSVRKWHVSPFKPTAEICDSVNERNVSPYKPTREKRDLVNDRHVSPYKPTREKRDLVNDRHVSPYKPARENRDLGSDEITSSNRKQETSRGTEKSNYSHRSVSAPRLNSRDKEQAMKNDHRKQRRERTPSPLLRNSPRNEKEATHKRTPSVGEINEVFANAKIAKSLVGNVPVVENTDSISQGDIFFSQDQTALTMQKIIFPKGGPEEKFSTEPKIGTRKVPKGSSDHNTNTNELRRTSTTSRSASSRQSSNMSDASGRTTESTRKFTANRRKSQSEAWFSCIKNGYCRTSKKSPEKDRAFDEASFIEKAFVVENLRQFWADKHRPVSLNGFTCHKQEAQLLKQIVSHEICPHILLKGPPGSGKKALTMAFLREIYGAPAWDISHDARYFQIQEMRPMQVAVPVTSSAHHVELNVHLEPNARYALMALVKQISSNHAVAPEISNAYFKADYSVMVLYDVDKAAENIQHLIKWIMDCYTDVCKLVFCCEDDLDILEPVKTRCEVLKVDPPVTHEIMEVLIQIARKENFDLSMSFAAKIATKSKQNLRKAIMALEACKAHNYPFAEDQPISMGWEEVLVELAGEILADPSPKRLCDIRGKLQKLLLDFVHPKLILQKLVEQFLKKVEASLKREVYYWHGYYEKRLPTGTSALLKLEEFVVKFMSIYRKSSGNHQYP